MEGSLVECTDKSIAVLKTIRLKNARLKSAKLKNTRLAVRTRGVHRKILCNVVDFAVRG